MALAGALEIQMFASIARISEDMRKVQSTVGGAMKNVESAVSTAKRALGALGIGIGLVGFARMVQGALDTQDALQKMSQKVNETVENLVGLKHAFELGGVQMEQVQKGLGTLASQMHDASMGLVESKRNFAALGIQIMNTDGTMKSATTVMLEMSNQMKKTGESTTNMALAKKLLGKAGLEMIPTLRVGSEEMRRMMEEGQRLYPVTAENARQAEILNDNLMILGKEIKSGAISTMNKLVPGINEVTEAMKIAAKEAGLLTMAWVGLGGAMAFALGMTSAQKETKWLGDVADKIAEVRKQLKQGYIIPGALFTPEATAKLEKQLKLLEAEKARLDGIGATKEAAAKAEAAQKAKAAAELAARAKAEEAAEKAAEKAAKEHAAREKRLREENIKGWVSHIDETIKEYEDGLSDIEKLADEYAANEKKLNEASVASYVAMAEAKVQANFDEAQQLAKDQIDAAEKIKSAQEKGWSEIWSSVEGTGKQVWTLLTAGGEDMAKSVGKAIKASILDLLYQLTARKWIISLGTSLSGASGAANAAGGIGSVLGGASNIASFAGSAGALGAASGVPVTSTIGAVASGAGYAGAGATGLMGTIGTVMPYVGLALAAAYAMGMFDSDERVASPQASGLGSTGTIGRRGFSGQQWVASGESPSDLWAGSQWSDLASDQLKDFNRAIAGVFSDMETAAEQLGLNTSALAGITVTMGQTGQGVQQDMVAALVKTADEIALKLMPNLRDLQQGTETLAQTFGRLAAEQAALNAQRRKMEIELMELTGREVEALAAKREDELAALDPTLRALQKQIYAAQDLAVAANDASSAVSTLADLLSETQSAVNEQIGASRSAAQAARAAAESFKQIGKALADAVVAIRGGGKAGAGGRLDALFGTALTGNAAALSALPQAGQDFLAASLATSRTSLEFARDQAKVVNMLTKAQTVSAGMVDWNEYQATLLELQTGVLEAIRDQLALPSPDAAILRDQAALLATIGVLLKDQTGLMLTGNAVQDVIKNINALGTSYSEQQLAALVVSGGVQSDSLTALVTGNAMTVSLLQQLVSMQGAATMAAYDVKFQEAVGTIWASVQAAGGTLGDFDTQFAAWKSANPMPSYAVGTSFVPSTGPAMLHRGERVTTAAANDELVTEIRRLNDKIDRMRSDTKKSADTLEAVANGQLAFSTEAA